MCYVRKPMFFYFYNQSQIWNLGTHNLHKAQLAQAVVSTINGQFRSKFWALLLGLTERYFYWKPFLFVVKQSIKFVLTISADYVNLKTAVVKKDDKNRPSWISISWISHFFVALCDFEKLITGNMLTKFSCAACSKYCWAVSSSALSAKKGNLVSKSVFHKTTKNGVLGCRSSKAWRLQICETKLEFH